MLELIAQGTEAEKRWRRQLPEGIEFELGRTTKPWSVGWDSNISRRHLRLRYSEQCLHVSRLETAANPVFYMGESRSEFKLAPGEHFVVGKTTFTLTENRAFVTQDVPSPIQQKTFSNEFLRQVPYRDADRRIEVLTRLPDVISSAANDEELLDEIVSLLLAGIPTASTVGVVSYGEDGKTRILHWDHWGPDEVDFQPSERLIQSAVEQATSVLYVWAGKGSQAEYTIDYENDWAFAIPLRGAACRGWGIYVAGKNRGPSSERSLSESELDLQGDIKFTELIGSTVANMFQVKSLERRQASLRPFFAPIVLQAMGDQDPNLVLAPRECDVSVLFCDLRGFSKTSEEMAGDLIGLLDRVSDKLGIMTRNILAHGGVVGDFHGDAAMGFWGWPLEQHDSYARACQAAIAIQTELGQLSQLNPSLATREFEIGMGIATGRAVVGKIGTSDQVKVTAFGPVVNLASRLEGLTRQFGCSILVDRATAIELDSRMESDLRTRRLAKVKPFGLQSSYEVFELLDGRLSSRHLEGFDRGVAAFIEGDWADAKKEFAECPQADTALEYLSKFMEAHGSPPKDWTGVIVASSK